MNLHHCLCYLTWSYFAWLYNWSFFQFWKGGREINELSKCSILFWLFTVLVACYLVHGLLICCKLHSLCHEHTYKFIHMPFSVIIVCGKYPGFAVRPIWVRISLLLLIRLAGCARPFLCLLVKWGTQCLLPRIWSA